MMTGRFRLVPVVPTETEFQETLARYLDIALLPPAVWWPMPIGHIKLTPAQAALFSRIGVKRGLPDVMVLHERVFGIELKKPKGRLSKGYLARRARGGVVWREGQAEVFPRLERAGMPIAVCDSLEGVIVALQGWGVPLRISTHGTAS